MINVTADANIYVSALHFGGRPLVFLEQARAGRFRLAASVPLLDEVRRVLRDKLAWSGNAIGEVLSELAHCTILVHPGVTIDAVPDDPDDNRVLECAVASGSAYIVTGDSHLLKLQRHAGIEIIRVAEFLALPA